MKRTELTPGQSYLHRPGKYGGQQVIILSTTEVWGYTARRYSYAYDGPLFMRSEHRTLADADTGLPAAFRNADGTWRPGIVRLRDIRSTWAEHLAQVERRAASAQAAAERRNALDALRQQAVDALKAEGLPGYFSLDRFSEDQLRWFLERFTSAVEVAQ